MVLSQENFSKLNTGSTKWANLIVDIINCSKSHKFELIINKKISIINIRSNDKI